MAPDLGPTDRRWMDAALALARRGLGGVWPNPAVGCVLVRDGVVVGRGWTQPGGRPHAETEALARAGEAARGAGDVTRNVNQAAKGAKGGAAAEAKAMVARDLVPLTGEVIQLLQEVMG